MGIDMDFPTNVTELMKLIDKTGGETHDFRDAVVAGFDVTQADVDLTRGAIAYLEYLDIDALPALDALRDESSLAQQYADQLKAKRDQLLRDLPVQPSEDQPLTQQVIDLVRRCDSDEALLQQMRRMDARIEPLIFRALPHLGALRLMKAYEEYRIRYAVFEILNEFLPADFLLPVIDAYADIYFAIPDLPTHVTSLYGWKLVSLLRWHPDAHVKGQAAHWIAEDALRYPAGESNLFNIHNTLKSVLDDVYQETCLPAIATALERLGDPPEPC